MPQLAIRAWKFNRSGDDKFETIHKSELRHLKTVWKLFENVFQRSSSRSKHRTPRIENCTVQSVFEKILWNNFTRVSSRSWKQFENVFQRSSSHSKLLTLRTILLKASFKTHLEQVHVSLWLWGVAHRWIVFKFQLFFQLKGKVCAVKSYVLINSTQDIFFQWQIRNGFLKTLKIYIHTT